MLICLTALVVSAAVANGCGIQAGWVIAITMLAFLAAQCVVNTWCLSFKPCSWTKLVAGYTLKLLVTGLTMVCLYRLFPLMWEHVLVGLVLAIVAHSRLLMGCHEFTVA
tara:strand:+ start:576 stop:902 length:327 start_codon:yes stop_codon:yes gene_type:complete